MKKNNRSFLSRFFSHNITLLVMAFLIAFTAWFMINLQTEKTIAINNIPVVVELPDSALDEDLTTFGVDNLTANVSVEGNPIILGSLSNADIRAVASPDASMLVAGTQTTLPLTAQKVGIKSDYRFVDNSLNPSSVTVYIDKKKEAEFDIENKITVDLVDKQNHYTTTTLSQSKVMVSGPETQVNKIASVAVQDTLTLTEEQQTTTENIVYLDENGTVLDLRYVTADYESVQATVTVLPIKTVTLTVDTANAPEKHPDINITPSVIKIAGTQDTLDQITDDKLSIGTLDFTRISNEERSQTFDITLPSGCKLVSGETTAKASMDLSSYQTTTVNAKVSNNLDSSEYSAEMVTSNTVEITVCGPDDVIENISASDITAVTDFGKELDSAKSGNTLSLTVPLDISLGADYADCWVYGVYTIDINVTKK